MGIPFEPMYSHLGQIAKTDIETIIAKDKNYGGSWKKRGGVGAYMMVVRKFDRMETVVAAHGYDIFKACTQPAGEDNESLLETVRDARRYLMMIEAELAATVPPDKLKPVTQTPIIETVVMKPSPTKYGDRDFMGVSYEEPPDNGKHF